MAVDLADEAGGVGFTLTAADYVVVYDPWWNPASNARPSIPRTALVSVAS